MKKLLFTCVLLLSLMSHAYAGQTNMLKQFMGEWEGTGTQSDGNHWRIRVNSRAYGYFIDYPSLVCGGVWTLLKTTDIRLVFKETLTYGIESCIDRGEIAINKVAENKMSYFWSSSQSKITAVGDLTRKLPASK